MSDLSRLVIKRFPENRNMQLLGLRVPGRFQCSRCKKVLSAKVVGMVGGDWERLLCAACYEEVLREPPEETKETIPREWLGKELPIDDIEDDNLVRGVPFGDRIEEWEEFKAAMADDDQIWDFCSPAESWDRAAGQSGYALVRNEQVVRWIVTKTG